MTIKLGITGNIASGKTTVEEILKKMGVKTFCADTYCHFLMENCPSVKKKVEKLFNDICEKEIDRKKIREIVFNNQSKREELEKILHPLVFKEIKNFFKENKNERVVAAVVPLLFEAKAQKLFDKIVLVCADKNIRFKRIKKRNQLEDSLIEKIISAQIPQEEKEELADFVLINNQKKKKELEKEIELFLKELK